MNKIRGFTLVELMVVLTVIALLLSVVVPDCTQTVAPFRFLALFTLVFTATMKPWPS